VCISVQAISANRNVKTEAETDLQAKFAIGETPKQCRSVSLLTGVE
jgi:hypothetical protein